MDIPCLYSARALPTGLSINSTTGLITGTIANSAAEDSMGGQYTSTVTVSDSQGHSGARIFYWAVSNRTEMPTLTNPGAQTTAEGAAVSLQVQATDPNGGYLNYTASGLPAGLTISALTGLISGNVDYTAAETAGGHYTTLVAVNNGNGGTASQTFTWTITDTDRMPWLAYPGLQNNRTGDTVSLQPVAGDWDGDTVTYSATGLPSGLSINAAIGLISGTITAGSGAYGVTVTVSDGHVSNSQTFTWQVQFQMSYAPRIILAINGTTDPRAAIAFLNPGQPAEVLPVQVTLLNDSAGVHQVFLNTTPDGRISLSLTSFQLANGGTRTVMLTPLQVGLVEDDALMMAGENGQQAGDEKVTVQKVTFGDKEHVRNADTPEQMIAQKIDRIPPRETTSISYTLEVPMGMTGKAVYLGIDQQSDDNGRAEFVGTTGARIALDSQSDSIWGTRQTKDAAHAGKLLLNVRNGASQTVGTTFKFSVAAIPVSISTAYKDDGRFKRKDGTVFAGLMVDMKPQSDSLERSDLDRIFVSEAVQDKELTGTLKNSPNVTAGYSKTPASDPFPPDRHLTSVDAIKAEGATAITNQVWIFLDNRTGAKDVVIANSGYIITVIIKKDPEDGVWKLTTTKKGDEVTVEVKDAGKVTAEYTAKAGLTDPKGEISTKKPIKAS
jgi:hypothetical protein